MNKHIKSVLEPIIQNVYKAQSLEEGKRLMKELVKSTKIKEEDKRKMLREVDNCYSLTKLQFYCTNAYFKFEGLGINGRTIIKK